MQTKADYIEHDYTAESSFSREELTEFIDNLNVREQLEFSAPFPLIPKPKFSFFGWIYEKLNY